MTLQELLAQYDEKRNAQEKRLAAQQQAMFLAHPELLCLQEQKKDIILRQLAAVMKKSRAQRRDFGGIRPENRCAGGANCRLSRKDRRADAGALFRLPLCQDSGYVQHKNRREFCPCLREQLYEKVLGGQRVETLEGSFAAFNEKVFPDAQQDGGASQRSRIMAIRSFAEGYCDAFPGNPQKQLLFMGKPGLGKSYLLACMCKQLRAKQRDICYLGAYALFELFHRDRLGEAALLEPVYEAKILVIDDLGSEPMTQNVTKEYFFDLLCARSRAGLHTFMATNHGTAQLKERYTERVSSRLLSKQNSLVIRFVGEDLRLFVKTGKFVNFLYPKRSPIERGLMETRKARGLVPKHTHLF